MGILGGFIPAFSVLCAFASLLASLSAVFGARVAKPLPYSGPELPLPIACNRAVQMAHVIALLLGVAAALIQAVILATQLILVALDLINGFPWRAWQGYTHAPDGLWTLGCLFASCGVGLITTGDRRLFTCQMWITVMIGLWACMRLPVFRLNTAGGFERTGSTVILLWCLSLLLAVLTAAAQWLDCSDRGAALEHGRGSGGMWPGLRASCGAVSVAALLLVNYHLAVPSAMGPIGLRVGFLSVAVAALVAAWPSVCLGMRSRSAHLVDSGFALVSLGIVSAFAAVTPGQASPLAEGYPKIFTAMIVGAGCAVVVWTHFAIRWRCEVRENRASSEREWLLPRARRCAFLTLSLALLLATLMAVWPRLPVVRATDDALGRVTAGLAANLFLLWVALWTARELRGHTFQALCWVSLGSTGGFLVVRLLPFTPRYG